MKIDESKPYWADVLLRAGVDGLLLSDCVAQQVEKDDQPEVSRHLSSLMGDLAPSLQGEDLVERVVRQLAYHGLLLATAESCTGGLLAKLVTDVSGSSEAFVESVVTYSNEAKIRRLGVSRSTLEKHGAVSRECVQEMLDGMYRTTGAQVCVAISGIAGPNGGTPEKPVGTVFVGVKHPAVESIERHQFPGNRHEIRLLAAYTAINTIQTILTASGG